MRKSLFTRYITVFLVIIFLSFSMLALVLGFNMTTQTFENRREVVNRSATGVSQTITDIYKPVNGNSLTELKNNVVFIDYIEHVADLSSDLRVFIFDKNGVLVLCDEEELGATAVNGSLASEYVQKLSAFETVEGYDELSGVFSARYLYYGAPIKTVSGEDTVGSVFVCSSAKGMTVLLVSTVKTIILASLWVFLATLIAVYFLSERIIGPLKDMSRAAKSYAAGNFDIRIPVRGDDEVAELASAFNQMATGLESLESMRSSFLANVSHDLKTPMTTISGFIDAILSGAIPAESQSEYLERIKSEVLRLSRLVNQLLDLSRIQAGDRKFSFEPFDICEVARQIVLSFEQKIDEKKLDVEFNCEDDRMKALADKDAIHQILYNICDNAVKFSRIGGKYKIDIVSKDKKIHVSVYNEGEGIPEEDLPFVFERFYKTDKSRGLDKTGVGLGLYIAKTIIDAHGEAISVQSEKDKFCRFEFTLKPAN